MINCDRNCDRNTPNCALFVGYEFMSGIVGSHEAGLRSIEPHTLGILLLIMNRPAGRA